ncbi:MAG: KamA family radical SAM protein [Dehalococcoidales bacterium]|nr:KamA family radical SAM protein [Dehalococcoidales bacterium]
MKTYLKTKCSSHSMETLLESYSSEAEDEPPSSSEESEPPGKPASNRYRLFGATSDHDWNDWKWQFRNRITSVEQLAKYVLLSAKKYAEISAVAKIYPLSITPYYLSLMDINDPEDPLARQAIPSILEITVQTTGVEDPLEEKRDSVVPGLIHRYPDRVLMVLTDICPMLCRHCTRKREWRNGDWIRTPEEIGAMIGYIRGNKNIRDVIISGGDCLTLSTKQLGSVISRLRQINHVEIIRIGTRFPVVLPQRIDTEFCDMLSEYGPIWLNTHFNHVNEITPESAAAIDRIIRSGVPVNNQSVLLRGINDTVEKQTKLCQGLLHIKVRPYYLFQCDEVQGTDHLRTTIDTGVKIIEGMRGFTSGLAIPNFAVDLPQGGGKVTLQPNYVVARTEKEVLFSNYQGHIINCHNPAVEQPAEPRPVSEATLDNLVFNFSEVRDADRVIV